MGVVAITGWLSHDAYRTSQDAQNSYRAAADHYAADADNRVRNTCSGLVSQAQSDCIKQTYDTARENQRNEGDLESQRIMAAWTAVMGGMAALGVALSALAVYLIYITFVETRRAASVAWRIGVAQTAAQIVLDNSNPNNTQPLNHAGKHGLSFIIRLKNLGLSAATEISVSGIVVLESLNGRSVESPAEIASQSETSIPGQGQGQIRVRSFRGHEAEILEAIGGLGDGGLPWSAEIIIESNDIFEGKVRLTFKLAGHIGRMGNDTIIWGAQIDPASVKREQIKEPRQPT